MPNENNTSGESEPIGARGGEIAGSERSDPPRDDDPDGPGDDGDGWGSEIMIALTLVGVLLLLAGLLFGVVSLGGFTTDTGEESGTDPAGANTSDATNASEGGEDVQEDDAENDTEPAAGDEPEPTPEEPEPEPEPEPAPEGPEEPANEPEPEPEPEPDNETEPEPDNETEPNETEPGNATEPAEPSEPTEPNETGNETNETDPEPGATAVVQVVDQAGAPVKGEPVTLVAMDGSESTRTTDENGVVVIELVAGSSDDVARFDVRVRDQEQTVYVQRDDVHGVQEVVFEVGESDPAGNATNETGNESAVATAF